MSGFPRLSETFATNELLALADRGALAGIFVTKPGDGSRLQPGNEKLHKFVRRLFGSENEQAEFLAVTLRHSTVTAVHGYFAHTPARVAQLAAEHMQIPFGFSVHARDARKVPQKDLYERAERAACVVACNHYALRTMCGSSANIRLVPHGVDLRRFIAARAPLTPKLHILAVGRLVEKKGFPFLLEAVSRLKFPLDVRIVGEGPQQPYLAQMITNKGLMDRVTLVGPQSHNELPGEFSTAHVVVVPSVLDDSGDRDGLPNVVLEAMASARPVIATDVGGINAAVQDGETGLLVPMRDPTALACALTKVATEPDLRERLGRNARRFVEHNYEVGRCTERFYQVLQDAYS